MTPYELAKLCDGLRAELAEAEARERRVRELHRRGTAQRRYTGALVLPPPESICLGCSDITTERDEDDGYEVGTVLQSRPWPCATIRALDGDA